MASHQNATCRTDARTVTTGARPHCVAAPTARGVECAVAELTDALHGCGDHDGAIIVAATAGCGEGACWIEDRLMSLAAAEAKLPLRPECDDTELLVVNA